MHNYKYTVPVFCTGFCFLRFQSIETEQLCPYESAIASTTLKMESKVPPWLHNHETRTRAKTWKEKENFKFIMRQKDFQREQKLHQEKEKNAYQCRGTGNGHEVPVK